MSVVENGSQSFHGRYATTGGLKIKSKLRPTLNREGEIVPREKKEKWGGGGDVRNSRTGDMGIFIRGG